MRNSSAVTPISLFPIAISSLPYIQSSAVALAVGFLLLWFAAFLKSCLLLTASVFLKLDYPYFYEQFLNSLYTKVSSAALVVGVLLL